MSVSGIYQIENSRNGKIYVGSAVDLRKRKIQHFRRLEQGTHENSHLQRAYKKYGSKSFTFSVIEFVEDPKDLIDREQYFIDSLGFDGLYNLAPKAGSTLGVKYSDEARKRMSAAQQNMSAETRRKMSEAKKGEKHPNYGKSLSSETKQKLSEGRKGEKHHLYGKSHSEETIQRMSEAHKGKPKSDDHRRRMSEANKGKTLSEDHRRKISVAKQNMSADTRRKISESHKGKTLSEDHRQKISQALKGRIILEESLRKRSEARQKTVNKVCLKTDEILQSYPAVTKAALDNGISHGNISQVIAGRRKSAGGFGWSLAE